MMGIQAVPTQSGARHSIDTSILKSKTGYAILKGGKFYDQTLTKRLDRLGKDVRVELRALDSQRKALLHRMDKSRKRSENLVQTYSLPPLKPSGTKQTKSTSEIKRDNADKRSSRQKHRDLRNRQTRDDTDLQISGTQYPDIGHMLSPSNDDDDDFDDFRGTICSPAPSRSNGDYVQSEPRGDLLDQTRHLSLNSSNPHITVEKCEEVFPPLQKRQHSPPEYALQRSESRTGSSNSLEVPSPIMQRRSLDGKMVSVVAPINMFSSYSRSEGSIPEALKSDHCTDDPRFRGLEAVLRPGTTSKVQIRTPTKIDIEFQTKSRSPSPRRKPGGRLLRREDEREYMMSLNSRSPP
ncbi:uncharacterized protein LOC110448045 [Mizuhopecten yessoensis]|uniref:Uncharacterized protein n=1 Tax=Mizuhopecten yessoensis TaxID=6573 RepID=A0A210QU25_MIZYE|nr:uncharacterized protein LOC110448045 [Mizuhopecten yessoensis]OWF52219.1 hypothetical protein KP79_PYT15684 [Mizuhopecten yessoensis]